MNESKKESPQYRQVTQKDFRANPAYYVREAKQAPIQVIDEQNRVRGTISFPKVPDAYFEP